MRRKLERRQFLKSTLVLSGTGLFAAGRPLPEVMAGNRQTFLAGYAPATRGTVESFWEVCDRCSKLGFRFVETNNGGPKFEEAYQGRSAAFREGLAKRNLKLVGLVQGSPLNDRAQYESIEAKHRAIARFLSEVGGRYIAVSGSLGEGEDDYRKIAAFLSGLGRRIWEESGIQLGFHNYTPVGVDRLMDLSDPRTFHFVADTGWLAHGGVEVLEYLKAYRERIITIHLKDHDPDIEYERQGQRLRGRPVPLGRGRIDFPPLIRFLSETEFAGFVHGEIGGDPEPIEEMRAFMVDRLGIRL